jgi:hypothetical protein
VTRPELPLVEPMSRGEARRVDERDLQTVMETLWDLRRDTQEILELLREDEDGQEEEAEDA